MPNTAPTFTVGTGIVSSVPIQSVATLGMQTDGKILVSGLAPTSSPGNSVVLRYNQNGSVDSSFGQSGMVFSTGDGSVPIPISQVRSNGKLLSIDSANYRVLRYNADGSLDNSFDKDGIVSTTTNSHNIAGSCIAMQPDGKILVTGSFSVTMSAIGYSSGTSTAVIVRYNADGSLDTGFGENGQVVSSTTSWSWDRFSGSSGSQSLAVGTSIFVQPDGQILIGTSGNSLQRYNTNGTLDKSFSTSPVSLDSSAAYAENGNPVVLNGAIGISDSELSASQNYACLLYTSPSPRD